MVYVLGIVRPVRHARETLPPHLLALLDLVLLRWPMSISGRAEGRPCRPKILRRIQAEEI